MKTKSLFIMGLAVFGILFIFSCGGSDDDSDVSRYAGTNTIIGVWHQKERAGEKHYTYKERGWSETGHVAISETGYVQWWHCFNDLEKFEFFTNETGTIKGNIFTSYEYDDSPGMELYITLEGNIMTWEYGPDDEGNVNHWDWQKL